MCVVTRPSDPNSLPVEIDYLLNGSPLEYTNFAFILTEFCDAGTVLNYRLEVMTPYDGDTFIDLNKEGDTLTIKSSDRSLAALYPLTSAGFNFTIHAESAGGSIEASIPFVLRFYEIEVEDIGRNRRPALQEPLEDIWLVNLDAHDDNAKKYEYRLPQLKYLTLDTMEVDL